MKEQDIIDLKFERFDVGIEESGYEAYHYYEYDIGDVSFITNSNDELTEGEWHVELFDMDSIRFKSIEDLKLFIEILKRNKL
jgi:hypothetical protein